METKRGTRAAHTDQLHIHLIVLRRQACVFVCAVCVSTADCVLVLMQLKMLIQGYEPT